MKTKKMKTMKELIDFLQLETDGSIIVSQPYNHVLLFEQEKTSEMGFKWKNELFALEEPVFKGAKATWKKDGTITVKVGYTSTDAYLTFFVRAKKEEEKS